MCNELISMQKESVKRKKNSHLLSISLLAITDHNHYVRKNNNN